MTPNILQEKPMRPQNTINTERIKNINIRKSEIKKLRLVRTLEYYDIPQLFIAEDTIGVRYLCLLYNVEENGELKVIGVAVSTDRLNDFVKGHIGLLTMFTSPELEDSIFHVHMKEEGIYAEHYNGILDSSMLPDEGYFFNNDQIKRC